MTLFWILAAAMILAALALLAPALWRPRRLISTHREQQNLVIARERLQEMENDCEEGRIPRGVFEQARLELEQALLSDLKANEQPAVASPSYAGRPTLLGLALLVPVAALGLYFTLGAPQMVALDLEALRTHAAQAESGQMPSIPEMIARLEQRLRKNPDDAEGWFMMGRTRMALEEYPAAVEAFRKVHQLIGEQPGVMVALADAITMANDGKMAGEPARLVARVLEIDPDDLTALWLAGMVAEEAGDNATALAHWTRLEPLLTYDPESQQRIRGMIAELRQRLGVAAGAAAIPAVQQASAAVAEGQTTAAPASAGAGAVRLRVRLAPELAGKAGAEESVFVYARAVQGPRLPLAAARYQVKDLPLEIILDDRNAMNPQLALSAFAEVAVGARISRSGDAMPKSGDLRGEVTPAPVGSDGVVEVVIDSVVP